MTTPDVSSQHLQGHAPGRRPPLHPVSIAAYVRLSFNEEVELAGSIGDAVFNAASKSTVRALAVSGAIGNNEAEMKVGLRRVRSMPVTGRVMGQPITGEIVAEETSISFEGSAGHEPLRYVLDTRGPCTNRGHNLGIKVVYQSYYSELLGEIERVPDAVMIALLLPVALYKQDAAYS